MNENKKRLCTICARGGSKGVKNKNINLLNGKPLIAYSIEQAKSSGVCDIIAISSDSDDILKIAGEHGADILIKRPDELATDTAPKLPVIQHALQEAEREIGYDFDEIIDIDPTSPLRISEDIVNCVKLLESSGADNVITAAPARRSPYFNMVELGDDGFAKLSKKLEKPIYRRQDSPKCYDMNASIYVWWRETLLDSKAIIDENTALYVMPEERSIDIDSELDYKFVEFLFDVNNK